MNNLIVAVTSRFRNLRNLFIARPSEAEDSPPRNWTTHDSNLALYDCLSTKTANRPALPPEIILQILEPLRWECLSVSSPADTSQSQALAVHVAARGGLPVIQVILSFPSLSAYIIRNLKCVEFTFTSKDQGWSSFRGDWGTYRNSWTWFEAGVRPTTQRPEALVRNDEEQHDTSESAQDLERYYSLSNNQYKRFFLQSNRHAGRELETYCIEKEVDDEMLQGLKEGDALDLLACAQYPGWTNQVSKYSIRLWVYDDLKEIGVDGLE